VAVRKLTSDSGLLLILDEIQTGIGRTGKMFCWQHTGVKPDIMTLAKGIGGGVPLGALVAKESVACFEPGDQGGTYNGNPLMTAVGLAVVDEVSKPEFLAQVRDNGEYLMAQLRSLSKVLGLGEVRGRGLLVALELGRDFGSRIVDAALEQKLLVNSPRPASLRFMPALNVTRQEIDTMLSTLKTVLQKVT
jgi:acetylornithine/N-succinyldiaminopimelate aminotransferase